MNILIFGLGALGTVYACFLKEEGHRVIGLSRKPVQEAVRSKGVRVTGIWGEHHAMLDEVVTGVDKIRGTNFDLVIATVKSYDTEEVAAEIARVLSPDTYVVLAQNGYGNLEAAAKHIPEDRLILGRVIFGAETTGPGTSKVTVIADDVILGSPKNLIDRYKMEKFVSIFREAGIPTRFSKQVMKYIWGKIIYNSALNSMGAILEVNYGKLAEAEHSRMLMESIVREIFSLLDKMGQETLWPDPEAYIKDFYDKLIPATASHHPSMLQDIQRGRRTEIDALNGAVVEMGKKHGVSTPVNDIIVSLVKAKEKINLP
ncbi:MAG: 2-dehydropantoate 2-reductase [Pelotomaculum sp. PtaB.Bin013]|uniref:2-dehydropantoate 2-reductase n=1 Tax=Pelotomaculum isophthalicicum JI TaxID=947010 RepID=A0A9X4JW33_9FIRM|nr:ketopantoate reductase family protein [Pelotomaculum isophthalicicum]MDF9409431.1 ketopantoate reductase family protein [Pelotomaculum isophthalicicum JI]OPX87474.1 MAG: 2-dehydropantoate 2-reductase [Pelotomaculum sp. PtaB.Bin013]